MNRTLLLVVMLSLRSGAFAQAPEFSLDKEWPRMPEGWKFRMVSNIAGDSKGRIYVAHRGAHPVVFFDKTGKFLGSLGEGVFQQSVNYNLTVNPPIPISREYWAHGLHVDPSDNVWVTDLGRQVVMKFSRDGKLLMTLGTLDQSGESPRNFHQPSSVAVAPSGDIYVADGYGNSRVVKFSSEGKYLKAWGKKGSGPGDFDTPHGIAVDAKGNVYVAERLNNRIQVFDSEGHFLAQWPNYSRADSIFITRKGQAYVGTGKGDIYKLDLSGRLLETIGIEKALGYPHGIFVDSGGSLYIADPIANSASQPPRRFVKK
jgi:hypothetical protein